MNPPTPLARTLVPSLLTLGLAAYLLLHFVEPDLALTWSYGHLHRRPYLPWIGLGLVLLLPVLARSLWQSDQARRPLQELGPARTLAGFLLLFAGLLGLSRVFPHIPHAVDSAEFILGAAAPDFRFNPRWYLGIRLYRAVASLLVPPLDPETFARSANVLLGAISLTALTGCARRLASNRGEAVALTLLVWTSFGVLQMSVGYLDIYPLPMAATSVYLWLSLRVLEGRSGILGPLLIAGLGPFFYIGLTLLLPSTLVLLFHVIRRPGGWRPAGFAALLVLIAMVLATLPGHGRPLAWAAWYADAAELASCSWGYSADSCLLPLDYMLGWVHLREIGHQLLLLDGIGLLFCALCTLPQLLAQPRRIDGAVVLLAIIAAGHFAFLLMLDPLFGPYSDWDAYTYAGVPVTLLGGYGFLLWGRQRPALFALLLGLALAAASVHSLARLNAMHLDYHRHIRESPCHVNCGPGGSYTQSCQNCTWDSQILTCECRTRSGTLNHTATMTPCRGGYANDDGKLRCE